MSTNHRLITVNSEIYQEDNYGNIDELGRRFIITHNFLIIIRIYDNGILRREFDYKADVRDIHTINEKELSKKISDRIQQSEMRTRYSWKENIDMVDEFEDHTIEVRIIDEAGVFKMLSENVQKKLTG